MEKTYKWKIDGFFPNLDANKIGKEIDDLSQITPQNLVEKAKNESTELHKAFEWDDKIAGEKYRIHQARNILTNIVVEVKSDEEKENEIREIRAFVNTKRTDSYKCIEAVLTNPTEREKLLEKAINAFKNARKRYETLYELQDVFDAIDKL